MTPDELKALTDRLSNPETSADAIIELNEKVGKMITDKVDADKAAAEANEKIGNLRSQLIEAQQASIKLAMAGKETTPTPETPHEETLEEFNKRMAEQARVNYPF